MKVSELIEFLKEELPQDAELCIYKYDSEWGEAGYSPVGRLLYKEIEVFDHFTPHPSQKNTVIPHYRKEHWVAFYPENDELLKYGHEGTLRGRPRTEES